MFSGLQGAILDIFNQDRKTFPYLQLFDNTYTSITSTNIMENFDHLVVDNNLQEQQQQQPVYYQQPDEQHLYVSDLQTMFSTLNQTILNQIGKMMENQDKKMEKMEIPCKSM